MAIPSVPAYVVVAFDETMRGSLIMCVVMLCALIDKESSFETLDVAHQDLLKIMTSRCDEASAMDNDTEVER